MQVLTIVPMWIKIVLNRKNKGEEKIMGSELAELDEQYWVEKAKPLVWGLYENNSLNSLKLLDTYLSRINARKSDQTEVRFTKAEFEKLVGVDRIRSEDMEKYADSLMQTLTVRGNKRKDGSYDYMKKNLFSDSSCIFDDDMGQYVITIDCNPKYKEFFFNLSKNGHIRYKLKNTIRLTSKYSVKLYGILVDMYFCGKGTWEVSLDELKRHLVITADRYKEFKFIRAEILKKCQKEINDKTDINFEFKTFGRPVKKVIFTINRLEENEVDSCQTKEEQQEKIKEDWTNKDYIIHYLKENLEITSAASLNSIAKNILINARNKEYVDQAIKLSKGMNCKNLGAVINNFIINGFSVPVEQEQKKQVSKNKFTSYRNQRNYTKEEFRELEKLLLSK